MHIDDWDESFLSKLDPAEYVRLLKGANVQSAMVYANSHIGLSYWPTATGTMHAGVRGRDVFGEIVGGCKREGLDVIAYYSLIFNNRAYADHPEWRIVDVEGRPARDMPGRFGRYGTVCPNNDEYRAFVEAQVAELLPRYPVDGIFFDMCFWPACCYCDACRARYGRDVGGDMPTIVNWEDPAWIAFQRQREEWIAEFGMFARNLAQRLQPGISVEHNSSVYTSGWRLATNLGLVAANTYIGGDLYGGADEQSFVCKLYENITGDRPFEFMTSRCYPNLSEHTSTKPKDLLEQQVYVALAHHGAFLFIDAIDPDGTLHAPLYDTMGEIFRESQRYEPYLEGERVQDVGIYFSFDSKFDPAENGQKTTAPGVNVPHLKSALALTRVLREAHVAFGVTTKLNLSDLSRWQAIVLPSPIVLDDAELKALRAYVERGGRLVAGGRMPPELCDLFGITIEGEVRGMSYIAPAAAGAAFFPGFDAAYPLSVPRTQVKARAAADSELLATVTLPYTDPSDGRHLASIHSDPPGVRTDYAALVRRLIGKGAMIWCSATLEAIDVPQHARALAAILRSLLPDGPSFESDAHPSLEITMYRQDAGRRLQLNLVNVQPKLPTIPLRDIRVRIRTARPPTRAVLLPDETPMATTHDGAYAEITVPEVRAFAMLTLDLA